MLQTIVIEVMFTNWAIKRGPRSVYVQLIGLKPKAQPSTAYRSKAERCKAHPKLQGLPGKRGGPEKRGRFVVVLEESLHTYGLDGGHL